MRTTITIFELILVSFTFLFAYTFLETVYKYYFKK